MRSRVDIYVEQIVEIPDRIDPATPVAVPISRWSSIAIVATVEFAISLNPMNAEPKAIRTIAVIGVSWLQTESAEMEWISLLPGDIEFANLLATNMLPMVNAIPI